MTAMPEFYEVAGHLVYGVPAADVILDEVGPPPYVPAPAPAFHFSRPWRT